MIFIFIVTYLFITASLSLKLKLPRRLFLLNSILILLFIGLRGYDNGSVDTLQYVKYALFNSSMYSSKNVEPGFALYTAIFRSLGLPGWVFLLLNGILSLYPIHYMIKKYSENPFVSQLLFFIIAGVYIMYFVCARQTIGMGIIVYSIIYFIENRKHRWLVFSFGTLLAWQFHNTSLLIALSFLLLNQIQIKRSIYIGLTLTSLLCCAFNVFSDLSILGSLFIADFTGESSGALARVQHYMEVEFEQSGGINMMGHIVITTICILHALVLGNKNYNSIFTKLYLVGVILSNIFFSFPEIYRTSGLFEIFGLVSIPYIINPLKQQEKEGLLPKKALFPASYLTLLLFVYAFYSFCASTNNQIRNIKARTNATLIPYEFCWEDAYNY